MSKHKPDLTENNKPNLTENNKPDLTEKDMYMKKYKEGYETGYKEAVGKEEAHRTNIMERQLDACVSGKRTEDEYRDKLCRHMLSMETATWILAVAVTAIAILLLITA